MSSPTPEQRREAAAALLGVDADCDDEDEIKRACRKLALRLCQHAQHCAHGPTAQGNAPAVGQGAHEG